MQIVADNGEEIGNVELNALILRGEGTVLTGAVRHYAPLNKFQGFSGGNWQTLNTYVRDVPAGKTSPGFTGDYTADSNYLYVCWQSGNWIRIPKDDTW